MIVKLDDQELPVSDEAIQSLLSYFYIQAKQRYQDMDPVFKGAVSAFGRKKLMDIEKAVYESTGDKTKAMMLRPEKGQDSVLKLLQILVAGAKEYLDDANIHIKTGEAEGHRTITAFSYELSSESEAR